jgi:hypothetical protein
MNLIDLPTHNGGRQFAALPQTTDAVTLRNHLAQLRGVRLGCFLHSVSESWIDFALGAHEFSINDQFGEYWFFVADPDAPDELLEQVVSHGSRCLVIQRRDEISWTVAVWHSATAYLEPFSAC